MENILIIGMGITGKSAFNLLKNKDVNIYLYDEKDNYSVNGLYSDFKFEDAPLINLAIKSPGIKPNSKIMKVLKDNNVEVVSDLEFFYRESKSDNIVAITGTNGKTTTTKLLYDIISNSERRTFFGGNIGVGVLDLVDKLEKEDVAIIEASSFQLEDTKKFKPKISIITNITTDHLDWHGSIENYREAKLKIYKNQDKGDFIILNYDDEYLKSLNIANESVYFFSTKEEVVGCYVKNSIIYFKDKKNKTTELLSIEKIKMPGTHNLENILGAVLSAILLGIEKDIIKDRVLKFPGVEHRIEFVKEVNGAKYYNDSKGTNPSSTIKAIDALKENIILIAGGYDKNTDFTELLKYSEGKVKTLILLGDTKEKIYTIAKELSFESIYIVENMEKAIDKSFEIASVGDIVLLSPACASWDMYKSFEERGNEFKALVKNYR